MDDEVTPVPVDLPRRESVEPLGRAVGHAAAGMLDYLIGVIDREDRLESGSGTWRTEFARDDAAAPEAVRGSALRLLRLAADADNFALLELIVGDEGASLGDLSTRLGSGRLPLAERVSDLVSAGLVVKIPEADQVHPTEAAEAIVRVVHDAVRVGVGDLRSHGS